MGETSSTVHSAPNQILTGDAMGPTDARPDAAVDFGPSGTFITRGSQ